MVLQAEFDRYAIKDINFSTKGQSALAEHIIKSRNLKELGAQSWSYNQFLSYLIENPIRIVVMGSYYRGLNLIEALTGPETFQDVMDDVNQNQNYDRLTKEIEYKERFLPFVKLVGVATDNPDHKFVSAGKRIWNHPEAYAERDLVPNLVGELNQSGHDISLYTDRVKTDEFNQWVRGLNADIAFMGTFGQLIDQERIDLFPAGIFNFHPVGNPQWIHQADAGPQPFENMIERNEPRCWMVMHETNTEFDAGDVVGMSSWVKIPNEATPPLMHQLSSPLVRAPLASFLRTTILHLQHQLASCPNPNFPGLYGLRVCEV